MYNRYIRNDQGTYTRISADESAPLRSEAQTAGNSPGTSRNFTPESQVGHQENNLNMNSSGSTESGPFNIPMSGTGTGGAPGGPPPQPSVFPPPPPPPQPEWKLPFGLSSPGKSTEGITAMLRKLLDKFHLDNVDTGDLILLMMLFFLFKEEADEELMIALGLLLIL